jgi:hypothetical protein
LTVASDFRGLTGRLLAATHVLAGLAALVVVVTVYLAPHLVGPYDESTGTVPLPVRGTTLASAIFWLALLLLVVDLLYLAYGRAPRRPLQHVTSEGLGGTVKVSRDAIEAALRTRGEALAEVSRLRVMVEQAGLKRLLVRAQFQAPDGVTILEASSRLRDVLGTRFRELVHLTEGWRVEFEMEFLGFQGKYQRPEADAEPVVPFTGPQYPIDDEDPFEGRRSG